MSGKLPLAELTGFQWMLISITCLMLKYKILTLSIVTAIVIYYMTKKS